MPGRSGKRLPQEFVIHWPVYILRAKVVPG
jgi:hypothetical protein